MIAESLSQSTAAPRTRITGIIDHYAISLLNGGMEIGGGIASPAVDQNGSLAALRQPETIQGSTGDDVIYVDNPHILGGEAGQSRGVSAVLVHIADALPIPEWRAIHAIITGLPEGFAVVNAVKFNNVNSYFLEDFDNSGSLSLQLKYVLPDGQAVPDDLGQFSTFALGVKYFVDMGDGEFTIVNEVLNFAIGNPQTEEEFYRTDPQTGLTTYVLPAMPAGNLISADAGDDRIFASAGHDAIDGGAGVDTVSYASSGAGVAINLSIGRGQGGYAEGDTFVSIENIVGSDSGDALTGNASDNTFTGGGGSDTIVGAAGADVAAFTGSHSDCFIEYSKAGDMWVVRDLRANGDGTDYLSGIEFARFADGVAELTSNADVAGMTFRFSDGGHAWTQIDTDNDQSWSSYTNRYDPQSRLQSQTGSYAAGGSWNSAWDTANANHWTSYTTNYDAQGRQILQVGNYDDGKIWVAEFDVDYVESWETRTTNYDQNGNAVFMLSTDADGSYGTTVWDIAGDDWWRSYSNFYNNDGVMFAQSGTHDDGRLWVSQWDLVNQFNWESKITFTNTVTNDIQEFLNFDDGTHQIQQTDFANIAPWTMLTQTYDADWSIVTDAKIMDNQDELTVFYQNFFQPPLLDGHGEPATAAYVVEFKGAAWFFPTLTYYAADGSELLPQF